MNTLESCIIASPTTLEEECAKFIIDEVLSPFVLHTITTEKEEYTLSLWIRSDAEGDVLVRGKNIPTTAEWVHHTHTFTAVDTNLSFYFNVPGNYYIYHPQLELGNKATEYGIAPEDLEEDIKEAQDTANSAKDTADNNDERLTYAESIIQQLVDRISMLVTDANGTTLWEQTADGGWTYSMAQTQESIESLRTLLGDLEDALGSTDDTVEVLSKAISNVESSVEWIKMTTFEDEPCIALGETDSEFKLLITNTRIMFMDGANPVAYVSNKALNIEKAVIKNELEQGPFVWKIRSNGNMGLVWKGVSS